MADVKNKSVNIYINSDAAEQALAKLQKTADALNKKIEAGRAAGKNMNAEIKKLAETEEAIKGVQEQIDKGLRPSFVQVQSQVSKLRNELKRMSEDAPGYADKFKQYREATAEFQRMSQAMNAVDEASKKMGGGLTAVGVGVASFFGNILANLAEKALGAVSDFFGGTIEEAEQAEKATSRLHNTLDNLGRGDAFDRITAKSDELAKSFKYLDNDNINEVFQQLITYGKLTEKQMNDLLPVIINFAAKSGISVNDSASVIVKALEGNGKALKEYGINIKDGKDVTERFGIVMSEMAPKVAGAAEAFEKTSEGIKAITTQDIANLQEEVGTKMLPLMAKWYQTLSMAIDGLRVIFNNTAEFLSTTYRGAQLFFGILKDIATFNPSNIAARIKQTKAEGEANRNLAQDIKERANIQQQVDATAREAAKATLAEQKQMLAGELALKDAASKKLAQIRSTGTFNANEERATALEYIRARDSANAIQGVITQSQDKRVFGNGNPDDDPAADAKAAEKRKQLLKEVEAFNANLHDLNFNAEQARKSDDQKEVDAINEKYKKILEEYVKLAKKIKGSPLHLALSVDDIKAENVLEVGATKTKQQQKKIKEDLTKAYQEQQEQSAKDYEEEKNKQAQRFANGEIDKGVYEANIAHIDAESKKAQLENAVKFSQVTVTLDGKEVPAVEQAAKDITRIKKEQLDKQTKDVIAAYEAQEAERKLIDDLRKKQKTASIQTGIIISKGKGDVDGQYAGQKELLQQERQDKLDALETQKEDSIKKITETGVERLSAETLIRTSIRKQQEEVDADYDAKGDALEREKTGAKLTRDIGYAQEALDIYSKFAAAKDARENAALAKELKGNDTKKAALKRQLNSKLISEQEYNRQVAALDKDSEAKKEALAKKQFERNKRIQIAQTLMNGAAGAVKLWVDPGFPAAIPLAIALAAETIGEVAVIASQKFADGGRVQPEEIQNGKVTTQPNIPTQPNGDNVLATVKTGEVILNEEQQKALGGPETFKAIGVPGFADGGLIDPLKKQPLEGEAVEPEKLSAGKIDVESNIPAQPNGDNVLATVKTGEVILNEEQQKALGGPATFKAAGVPGFAGGGTIKPFWKDRPYERMNFSKVSQSQKEIRHFAAGGLVRAANATATAAGQISTAIETQRIEVAATDPALIETLQLLGNTVADLKKRLDNGIDASVSLKKLDDARNLQNRILKEASMK